MTLRILCIALLTTLPMTASFADDETVKPPSCTENCKTAATTCAEPCGATATCINACMTVATKCQATCKAKARTEVDQTSDRSSVNVKVK